MKCGSRMALGVAGGYMLGRSRRAKLAVFLAILAAGGKLPVHPGELARRVPVLGEGGPMDQLTTDIRGRLLDAGKSAAMAAASSRIDSLSDKLERRTAMMRGAEAPDSGESRAAAGESEPTEPAERRARTRPRERVRPSPTEEDVSGGERHLSTRPRQGMRR